MHPQDYKQDSILNIHQYHIQPDLVFSEHLWILEKRLHPVVHPHVFAGKKAKMKLNK